jgi:hypothetical protein
MTRRTIGCHVESVMIISVNDMQLPSRGAPMAAPLIQSAQTAQLSRSVRRVTW